MTQQGPQHYPGADQTHRYQDRYGGDAMEVNVVVLHTTEGRTLPDYNGGSEAPNLTAVPDFGAQKLRWYQHFDIDTSSRALVNLAGGVETNTLNVCQVELVGTCDPATHTRWGAAPHIYWPQAPDWALRDLAQYLAWMHDEHGVPLSGPALWLPYPASYGTTIARMTGPAWNAFRGVCGHQHVPENLHGDPGAIDFARIITLAKTALGLPPASKPPTGQKPQIPAFPGRKYLRDGANNKYVTQLGERLVAKGFGRYYHVGPGPHWGDADRNAVRAYQKSRKELRGDADGYPGPLTWRLLFS